MITSREFREDAAICPCCGELMDWDGSDDYQWVGTCRMMVEVVFHCSDCDLDIDGDLILDVSECGIYYYPEEIEAKKKEIESWKEE